MILLELVLKHLYGNFIGKSHIIILSTENKHLYYILRHYKTMYAKETYAEEDDR